MNRRLLGFAVCAFLLGPTVAPADFVKLLLLQTRDADGEKDGFVIEGKVLPDNGTGMLTLNHEKYGQLILRKNETRVIKAPNQRKRLTARMKAAKEAENYDELWKLAKESIRFGAPGNYFRAAEILGEAKVENEEAARTLELAELIDKEIDEAKDEETAMNESTGLGDSSMKFARSPHFLLMQDLVGKGKQLTVKKKPKEKSAYPLVVKERLDVMERVYRSYFGYFASRGVYMTPPEERLHIVLFQNRKDFKAVGAADSKMDMDNIAGYYSLPKNVSFFFENRSSELYTALTGLAQKMAVIGKDRGIANRGDFVRDAKMFDLLAEILAEQEDLETLSHECTHHLAVVTGLQPAKRGHPHWMIEGLAAFFESAKDANWSGVGAINEFHLKNFRRLKEVFKNEEHNLLDVIFRDRPASRAKDSGSMLLAYSCGWAVTHFLMEKHFDKLMALYKRYSSGPDVGYIRLKEEAHIKHVDAVFPPSQRDALNKQFLLYIAGLKTDLETVSGIKDD